MWLILAEDGGGTDLRYSVRFYFAEEAAARAAGTKLNNIASAAYNLATLPPKRQANPGVHAARLQAAMAVLNEMDPDGTPTTIYRVQQAGAFTPPSAPPANALQALFQGVRDLTD